MEKDNPNSTTMDDSPGNAGINELAKSLSTLGSSGIPIPRSDTCVKPISPEQTKLISKLVNFQDLFEQLKENDLKRITDQLRKYPSILPGFNELLREDQITLLNACSSEVMMLRMARYYDVKSDSIIFSNDQRCTSNDVGIRDIEDLLQFCRQAHARRVDCVEYALLTAIIITSERPNLIESRKVEELQGMYLETLKAYLDNCERPKYESRATIFANLLSFLIDLRTLGNQNNDNAS